MVDYYNFRQLPNQIEEKKLFKYRSYAAQSAHYLLRTVITIFFLSIFIVLLLRWITPPSTSFIVQRQYKAWQNGHPLELQHQWVSMENISPHLKMAAISSEDQRFSDHWGLDINSIQKAIKEQKNGEDLRGASTITQQVAKNLFLWSDRSYLRKSIEAYLAIVIELLWPKKRILEVYLNIVEFGDGIYGAEAAAKRYFNKPAAQLSKWESAYMVTALPAPKRYNLDYPSDYMLSRSAWVMRYMDFLGNASYLEKIDS
ncbi:monofunctional biosynthetic peptidoglycan transglycosylase [Fodinibius saliphilus]|uniref:monofunctional biosynthetic peptidoglycan transglycosylase n=1 Tax=Fodinibius saliphilus TaxID=1920650 RepID=UPI001107ECE4|nr:monofunctional biosynthetic peptidoglycan transglycosylase [Fodinibius saliphilus]